MSLVYQDQRSPFHTQSEGRRDIDMDSIDLHRLK